MTLTSILIIGVFAVIVLLMVFDKISGIVALPLMAIAMAIIAGVPVTEITNTIIGKGITVLASAIFSSLIAAVLGELIKRTGIAEKLIRTAAELGGDNPYLVAILCFFAVGFSFIGLYGAGARIMMGIIIFPIMLSVGVPKVVSASILLASSFLGYYFNVARWNFIKSLVNTDIELISKVALVLCVPGVIVALIFIIIGIKIKGPIFSWAAKADIPGTGDEKKAVPVYALITPVVPLIFVLALKWDVNAAFIAGMLYGIVTTQWKTKFKGVFDMLNKCCYEGFSAMAITITLMFGIGMVITAAQHKMLLGPITDVINLIVPTNPVLIVILFGLIGPMLTLYRGPLNPWGLGAALASILATTSLPVGILVAMFWLYDYFVGVNDPTASQVVWSIGYLQVSGGKYTRATIGFNLGYVLIGIIIAVCWFI
ncbi:MAG: hypothetical protein LBG22_10490 [Treponema sp.]|jgi:H+/gluconate symporter-like permease|nr:hypothetical protein [Treponema sp.]